MNKENIYIGKEKKYCDDSYRISTIMNHYLETEEDFFIVNLDGAKPGSDMQQMIDEYPDRVLNSGIAEQNMIGVGAGIALLGKKVICISYGPFVVMRGLEQIYMDMAYNNSNLCIILTNVGICSGEGATHNNVNDIAILNSIPNIQIVTACDPIEAKEFIDEYMNNPRPLIIRCGGAKEPLVYKNIPSDFRIGRVETIYYTGNKLAIFTYGITIRQVLDAMSEIKGNYEITLVDTHTIKPLDEDGIANIIKSHNIILCIEDSRKIGGLSYAISEIMCRKQFFKALYSVGLNDEFEPDGTREQLQAFYGIDSKSIKEIIEKIYE